MALGNTPRRETNISVEASKSYAFGLYFKTPDGLPVDMSGSELRLVAAEPPHVGGIEVLSKVAVSDAPETGFVQFNLQAEDLALDPNSYAYDVTLLPPTGYSTPILKGYIEVGPNTDVESDNVYTGVYVGSDLTVYMEHGDVVQITIERVDGMYTIVSNLIENFADEMSAEVDRAEEFAGAAAESAELSKSYHDDMQVWLDNAGYPFWKGTQTEYEALTPKREVLYLITDEVTNA